MRSRTPSRKKERVAAPEATRPLFVFALLAVATLAAYQPVWHGAALWDDDAHLTPETLSSTAGLWRIWTDVSVSQQYYPVVGTAFWMMNRLWGHEPFGYHIVNILLHAFSAFLVAGILRRWRIPGALLAAFVFALHPVHVESVAWMTELKNTLSGVFYLLAFSAYIRFDEHRDPRSYVSALVLFALALGSKTVTATLPAALLVVFWWRRGRISWTQDVRPLVPFFAIGMVLGLGTAWLEATSVGASGAPYALSFVDRVLLAGRAIWFYLASIVWPANLIFIYPRWSIDSSAAWQYLYPAGVLLVLAGLWAIRSWSRAPLAGALFFGGTLFPALGFLNVYPFRFSYVADHFQYLASLGVIVVLSAALARWLSAIRAPGSAMAPTVVIGAALFALTFHESAKYRDAETLYRATLADNPRAVMAHTNLAALLLDGPPASWTEAMAHAEEAVRLDPGNADAHANLGLAYERAGRLTEGERAAREAIRLKPDLANAHFNLGIVLGRLGRTGEAITSYESALKIHPRNATALTNLGLALTQVNRTSEGIARLREAIAIDPDSADIRWNLANVLFAGGALAESISMFESVLSLRPDWGEAHHNLGLALRRAGRTDDALRELETAARLLPGSPVVATSLATTLVAVNRLDAAIPYFQAAIARSDPPRQPHLYNELGIVYVRLNRPQEAAEQFRQALRVQPDFAPARQNLQRIGRAPQWP